jgi:hypothetical protein
MAWSCGTERPLLLCTFAQEHQMGVPFNQRFAAAPVWCFKRRILPGFGLTTAVIVVGEEETTSAINMAGDHLFPRQRRWGYRYVRR